MKIYTVRACRWGSIESHSYIVGVYRLEKLALDAAKREEKYRNGKYSCEVIEWRLFFGKATINRKWGSGEYKIIKRMEELC